MVYHRKTKIKYGIFKNQIFYTLGKEEIVRLPFYVQKCNILSSFSNIRFDKNYGSMNEQAKVLTLNCFYFKNSLSISKLYDNFFNNFLSEIILMSFDN